MIIPIRHRLITCILLIFSLFAPVGHLLAQQIFPIEANVQITPPYSLYLSDYTSGEGRMKVNLFLKDLSKTNYPVRLKFSIESFGISITSKNNFYTPPIYLNGGQLTTLSGPDLQDYLDTRNLNLQGIDLRSLNQNGAKLPEGVYRISVAVEDYTRRQVISNTGSVILSVFLSYPPLINMPMQDSKITGSYPQNIIFQWTPRHTASPNAAFNVAYKIRLVEINPPGRDPNDAIRSSRPIFETLTNQTQYHYGPAEPQLTPGNTYALQVQALEAEGKDIFVNNGNSEVIRFTYGDKCGQPLSVLAELSDQNKLKISWIATAQQQRFSVRYKEANKTDAQWFEQEVYDTQFTATSLRPGKTYQYQVKADCGNGYGDYTSAQQFKLPDEQLSQGDFVCGQPDAPETINLDDLLPDLPEGIIFLAGKFPVYVTEVTSQEGTSFRGKGTVGVPMYNKLSFRVEFDNIQINKKLQLVSGKVSAVKQSLEQAQETVIEAITVTPDESGVVQAIQSNGLPTIIDAAITVPSTPPVYNAQDKTVKFAGTTNSGQSKEITIQLKDGQPPFTFQDKNGQTYEVEQNGKVTPLGKLNPSQLLAGSSLSSKPIDNSKAKVSFIASINQKYGLDTFNESLKNNTLYAKDYQSPTPTPSKGEGAASWKSVEAMRGDEVWAKIEKIDDGLDLTKIKFNYANVDEARSTLNGNTFTITLTGAAAGNDKDLYAVYQPGGENTPGANLGKLNIASYNKISKKVVIVPVNGAGANLSQEQIETYLNKVYQQAVVEWQVSKAENFTADKSLWDTNNNGLDVNNSAAMSAYTAEQKALGSLYKKKLGGNLESGTFYLFLVDKLSDPSQDGYMVRSGQVGFVRAGTSSSPSGRIEEGLLRTIAHELGHGAFNLPHTWEVIGAETKGTTGNLMDYSPSLTLPEGEGTLAGGLLWHSQWVYMHNPDIVIRAFEGDDEGANKQCDDALKLIARQITEKQLINYLHLLQCESKPTKAIATSYGKTYKIAKYESSELDILYYSDAWPSSVENLFFIEIKDPELIKLGIKNFWLSYDPNDMYREGKLPVTIYLKDTAPLLNEPTHCRMDLDNILHGTSAGAAFADVVGEAVFYGASLGVSLEATGAKKAAQCVSGAVLDISFQIGLNAIIKTYKGESFDFSDLVQDVSLPNAAASCATAALVNNCGGKCAGIAGFAAGAGDDILHQLRNGKKLSEVNVKQSLFSGLQQGLIAFGSQKIIALAVKNWPGKYKEKEIQEAIDGVNGVGDIASLLAKWENLTIEEVYTQLAKTEIQGSKSIVSQSSILAEINASNTLVNPYNFAHPIEDIVLNSEAMFVRIHNSWNPNRPWLITIEEFRAFSSQDDMIKKLALPILDNTGNVVKPAEISIVKLPIGTKVRKSVARPQDWPGQGHQPGGAIQFEIRDQQAKIEWFKKIGTLSEFLQ